jgi:hypothetical protein
VSIMKSNDDLTGRSAAVWSVIILTRFITWSSPANPVLFGLGSQLKYLNIVMGILLSTSDTCDQSLSNKVSAYREIFSSRDSILGTHTSVKCHNTVFFFPAAVAVSVYYS